MANDVSIFVSATCKDIEDDLRPAVLDAITFAKVEPVSMESWEADYINAVELCRAKLTVDATHYLGVFGYWRGWVPDGQPRSITEIEYDIALIERSHAMAIFIPNETSRIGVALRRRVDEVLGQAKAETEAQLKFISRVLAHGAVEQFDSEAQLALRVQRKAVSWSQGGLRGIARATPSSAGRRPGEGSFAMLGFDRHVVAFRNIMGALALGDGPQAACFLIRGPSAYGHKHLARRLEQNVPVTNDMSLLRVSAGIAPAWRQAGAAPLISVLSTDLGADPAAQSPEQLAEQLKRLLESRPVVLHISALQRYAGAVRGFADSFWKPIVNALGVTAQPLICLASIESAALDAESEAALHDDANVPGPADVFGLPPLTEFTAAELAVWLRSWTTADKARDIAGTLIAETNGVPFLLYSKLLEDSTWA